MSQRVTALEPVILEKLGAGQHAVNIAAQIGCKARIVRSVAAQHGIALRRGRPPGGGEKLQSPQIFRRRFIRRFGDVAVQRFIRRCETSTLAEVASSYGWRTRQAASRVYKRLTGGAAKPCVRRPRGRRPGYFNRPDVTLELIEALATQGLSQVSIARRLNVSRRTIYNRLGPRRRGPGDTPGQSS